MAALVPVITIDGPAASGKGTVARLLAQYLGFNCLDSGKIYRAAGMLALQSNLALDDEADMLYLAGTLVKNEATLSSLMQSPNIGDEAVGAAASQLAAIAGVRAALLPLQRTQLRPPGLVADGRDMGTVVFPDAVLKVFLTADINERARRRWQQLQECGMHGTMKDIFLDLRRRDEQDSCRAQSPLRAAADSLRIDSTQCTPEELASQLAKDFIARCSFSPFCFPQGD
ncbi:(d)CMP kinase [Candidatus Persebacteraceae bacterium Df01]|uniref:Cytidylate kinase n=1 Tax=Candidatus Doriopsillibacter californiensis TaxID=2970740 RepID=A0ABT7QKK1_9GAMM|nr:(d)CMP kinase [Candidatus Persebacteraceae bacterium Df01]